MKMPKGEAYYDRFILYVVLVMAVLFLSVLSYFQNRKGSLSSTRATTPTLPTTWSAKSKPIEGLTLYRFNIDGCEYLIAKGNIEFSIVHRGNCIHCAKRRADERSH